MIIYLIFIIVIFFILKKLISLKKSVNNLEEDKLKLQDKNNSLEKNNMSLKEENSSIINTNNSLRDKINNYKKVKSVPESERFKDLDRKFNQLSSDYIELKSLYTSSKIKVHNLENSNHNLNNLIDKYKEHTSSLEAKLNKLKSNSNSSPDIKNEDIKAKYKYLSRNFPKIENYFENRNWNSPSYTDRYDTHTLLKLREILPLIWIGKIKKGRLAKTNFPHYFDSYDFNKDKLMKKYIKLGFIVEKEGRYLLTDFGNDLTQQYQELWDMLPSYNDFPINIDKDYPVWNHGLLKQKWIKERIEFLQDTNTHLQQMVNLLTNNPTVFKKDKKLSISIDSMKHAIQENNNIINQLDNGDKEEFNRKINTSYINNIKERKIELFNAAIKNASNFTDKLTWNTLEDNRVCELCKSLNQKTITSKKFPDPYQFYEMHPNCRCFLSTKIEN